MTQHMQIWATGTTLKTVCLRFGNAVFLTVLTGAKITRQNAVSFTFDEMQFDIKFT